MDSLIRVPITPEDLTWDPLKRTMTVEKILDRTLFLTGEETPPIGRRRSTPVQQTSPESRPEFINELNLRSAAFISIEGDSSEANVQHIQPVSDQDLSSITIEIRTEEPNYLVQLLDNTQKVVQEIKNQPLVRFANVVPGEYHIRLVIDRDGNGRWDPGNYFAHTPPEPIIYYRAPDGTTPIKGVKANWHIGEGGEMLITY